jgi:recombinational DNA repair protein (RecF pathway)
MKINNKLQVQLDEKMQLMDMYQAIYNTKHYLYFVHKMNQVFVRILSKNKIESFFLFFLEFISYYMDLKVNQTNFPIKVI